MVNFRGPYKRLECRETFLVLMKRAVLVHRPESRQTLSAMEDDDGACLGGLCIENVEYVYLSRQTVFLAKF